MARPVTTADYERRKEDARARAASESRVGRDIGDIPAVVNSQRKATARASFRAFCESYFPRRFTLPWSNDHLKVIAKIEAAVLRGGLFAMAMPRGSGKTTLCECAALWAILIGAHPFVFLIGSCEDHALTMLGNLKAELMHNELLLEDFPEAIYPIRRLENQSRRCVGQLHHGQPTHIAWTADQIIMPTIPGSRASGAIVRVAGLTGNLRGAVHTRPDGRRVRPTLVVLDDPQTDQSARSPSQCAEREATINGAVLGLAGPGRRIAAIMPCTVIRPADLADRMLDREKHPQWQGERTRMVYTWPANEKLWDEYARIRAEELRNDGDGSQATDFYCHHRQKMDEGAVIAWPQRFDHDELSAVQHAVNLRLRDERAFFAEYQNDPLPAEQVDEDELTADAIAAKVNGLTRGTVPMGCDHLTMFIDVQQKLLFYLVAAWESAFTGYVIDYGTWPDQRRPEGSYFTLRDAKVTLAMKAPKAGLEGSIYAGLEALTGELLSREWRRDDGAMLRIERCLIDANWGASTEVIYQFCRQTPHAPIVMPSHGRYVGASSIPFSEYKRKRGDRVGLHWRIPNVQGRRAVRYVLFDSNWWKTFVHARLAVPMGDAGCLSLFGRKPDAHRLLADHLTAEYRVRTEGRGRTVDEWKLRVAGAGGGTSGDNHWLDCLVGCAVAASMQGAVLFGTQPILRPREHRIRLSELQRTKR